MIRTTCPNCSKMLGVADSRAGKTCKCPVCACAFRAPATSRQPVSLQPGAGDSYVADDLELVEDEAPHVSPPGVNSSARGPARRGSQAETPLDDLEEVVDEEPADAPSRRPGRSAVGSSVDSGYGDRPRRKGKKRRGAETPQWVYVTAAVAGVALCGLGVAAAYFRNVAFLTAALGIPLGLTSRKWPLLGWIGGGYLLTGAGLVLFHASLITEPPRSGFTAEQVDRCCADMMWAYGKAEAGSFVGVEKPGESARRRKLRAIVTEAYANGAPKVWVTDFGQRDATGQMVDPKVVILLATEQPGRDHLLTWYRQVNPALNPGNKYAYLSY